MKYVVAYTDENNQREFVECNTKKMAEALFERAKKIREYHEHGVFLDTMDEDSDLVDYKSYYGR